jgi:flagellar biosynthesis protein FlhA
MTIALTLGDFGERLRRYTPGSDVGLALGMLALLAVLVVPLPTVLLDVGLALSITAAVLVLMVAMLLKRPLDFTSFPTLLLLTALLRDQAEITAMISM